MYVLIYMLHVAGLKDGPVRSFISIAMPHDGLQ